MTKDQGKFDFPFKHQKLSQMQSCENYVKSMLDGCIRVLERVSERKCGCVIYNGNLTVEKKHASLLNYQCVCGDFFL